MKIKTYATYKAGSTQIGTVYATCITKAAKRFIETLKRPATFELNNREEASIRYTDNFNVMSDYIVTEL